MMECNLVKQDRLLAELVSVTKEIIEQQLSIRDQAEHLQRENSEMQAKSKALQKVLEDSKTQLQTSGNIC